MQDAVTRIERTAGLSEPKSWLVSLDDLARDENLSDRRNVGGKASRLAWLHRHGLPVPPTWVLSRRAFDAALRELPPACEPKSLLRAASTRAIDARAAAAREQLLAVELPQALESELEALWSRANDRANMTTDTAPWGFAVRSSATCEDGALVSMAGLAESVIGVRGPQALADAIRHVWASIASGRALEYLAAHGVRDVAMAVVIQPVVQARAAGVMFTRIPATNRSNREKSEKNESERIINAGVGLGAPVVDGVATPDMIRLNEEGEIVERTVARKEFALVVDSTGLAKAAVERPDEPALESQHHLELASVARRLEQLEDVPWDVEFACDRQRVWVLQARHVTGLGFPEGGDAHTVWSNCNVGEALPGVATPLTWSVAKAYSEAGFRKAFGTLGCSVGKHVALIGNVHGRFYLNLSEFMRIAAQVPWLDPRSLLELGGGRGGDELAQQNGDVSHRGFFVRLPLTATRLLREQARLDDMVESFERELHRSFGLHNALDLAILPDAAIAKKLRDVQGLLERTGDVMLTCASSSLGAHLALKQLLKRAHPDDAERLAHDLTRGIADLESARPALGVMRIAQSARREPEAKAALEQENAQVSAIPEGPTKRALVTFLDLYGDRAIREAELSTARWREDPAPVLAMIRAALRDDSKEVDAALGRVKTEASAELQRVLPRLSRVQQALVRHLVARAQKAARRREQMRAHVTRVLGMLRHVALEADRRLMRLVPELGDDWAGYRAAQAPLAQVNAVFFLALDEVMHALRVSRTDLAPLVRARCAEYLRDCARPDPPSTFVGVPHAVRPPIADSDELRGLPASSGVVQARVRVLYSASQMSELRPGEVLVVHTTDVGWTPLFWLAAAVVTELGGPLSHAAVVAREIGVPSVVNVDGATRVLKTGDLVRVDGEHGSVSVVSRAAS